MKKKRTMDLVTICGGLVLIKENAVELLEEAELLFEHGKFSRSYALAYFSCEEAGKLPILVGVATQIVLGMDVDWNSFRKRLRSHSSKASQFVGLAMAMPVLARAVAEEATVNLDELSEQALAGVLNGPDWFGTRNASIYSDIQGKAFVKPSDQITSEIAKAMISVARMQVQAAQVVVGSSAEEAAERISRHSDRDRYNATMAHLTEVAHSSLSSGSKRYKRKM